jgi:hypothetical protein
VGVLRTWKAGDEHDPLAYHPEEESVWEPANEDAARLGMKNRKGLGSFEHCLNV